MKLSPLLMIPIVASMGCGAVPDLSFESPDGGAPSAPPVETISDGGPVDASEHDATAPPKPIVDAGEGRVDSGGTGVDAGPSGCPSHVPAGANLCCGDVPCVGLKCYQECNECAACSGSFCCVPNGLGPGPTHGVTCAATAAACGP
jgi:hypothetical protein